MRIIQVPLLYSLNGINKNAMQTNNDLNKQIVISILEKKTA